MNFKNIEDENLSLPELKDSSIHLKKWPSYGQNGVK
jgi:hypothetical protein